jgi:hypothetical protein
MRSLHGQHAFAVKLQAHFFLQNRRESMASPPHAAVNAVSAIQWNASAEETQMYEQIPVAVLEQYVGKWIFWDQEDKKVVASSDSLQDAESQVAKLQTDHLLRLHHVLPPCDIAGML